MRLYAITHRFLLPGPHHSGGVTRQEERALVALAREWAEGGVAWIQLREKDLPPAALQALARRLITALEGSATRLLLNGPAPCALAAGASGVHLPGGWSADAVAEVRAIYAAREETPLISLACHSVAEAHLARQAGADLILFAPVFAKTLPGNHEALPGQGLDALTACSRAAAPTPVLALGGVTAENASDCLRAGAQGVAAIRLFLEDGWRPLAEVE